MDWIKKMPSTNNSQRGDRFSWRTKKLGVIKSELSILLYPPAILRFDTAKNQCQVNSCNELNSYINNGGSANISYYNEREKRTWNTDIAIINVTDPKRRSIENRGFNNVKE